MVSTNCRGSHFNFRHIVNGEHSYICIIGVMNCKLTSQFIPSEQVVCINMGFSVTVLLTPNFGIDKSLVSSTGKITLLGLQTSYGLLTGTHDDLSMQEILNINVPEFVRLLPQMSKPFHLSPTLCRETMLFNELCNRIYDLREL